MTFESMDPEKFSEWYHNMLEDNEVVDTRYPVKGMPVYRSYGMRMIKKFQRFLEDLLEEDGHEPMLFPIAIPEDLLEKEKEHIAGFEEQVYWITHAGANELDRRMALRPTSETCMYPMFKLWTRSHADLPIKIHQSVAVYRYETKHTRPLIRSREICWNEGHTAFATREEALENIESIKDIYGRLINELLCIPFQVNQRPDWDKFPGAEYTIAFETIMPDGKTLQVATIHNLGQHFSKVFDLSYDDEDGKKHYAWQTSYGPGFGRLLAAVISVHGDEKGLILPPEIAPIQAVIVPILFKDKGKDELMTYVKKVEDKIKKQGVRFVTDLGDGRPGDKFYKWEKKGVPIRIEAGPRDMKDGKVVVVRRDTGEKNSIALEEFNAKTALSDVQDNIRKIAQEKFDSRLWDAKDEKELDKNLGNGIVSCGWCFEDSCAPKIEAKGTILSVNKKERKNCVICGAEGAQIKVAKTY